MSSQPPIAPAQKPRRSPWSAYRVALTVIAGLVACVSLHLKFTYDKAIRDAETLIQALAVASEQHIGSSLEALDALLDELALTVRDGRHNDRRFIDSIGARLSSYPEVRYLGIADANGTLSSQTWPGNSLPTGAVDISGRRYFIEQRDATGPARMVVGDPIRELSTGERTLHLSRPIRDRNGAFAGIVVAAVNPDTYAGFLSSILYDEDGSCGLISVTGQIIARAPNQADSFARDISDSDLIRLWAPNLPIGVAHLVAKTDANDKLLAYRVLPEYSVMVTAGISRAKGLGAWRRMAVVELALLVAFSALLLYWTRHIRRQHLLLATEQHTLEEAVAQRTIELEAARTLAERRTSQLARINEELKRLTLVASHHLQEPLRSIVSCSQMLARSVPPSLPDLETRTQATCQQGLALKARLSAFEARIAELTRLVVSSPSPAPPSTHRDDPPPPYMPTYSGRMVAAAIAGALLVGNTLQARSDYQSAIAAAENLTAAVVKSIAHHLQGSFRRIDTMLDDVALAAEDGRIQTEAFSERLTARLATMPEVMLVTRTNSSGLVWPRTWPETTTPTTGMDVSSYEYFREQTTSHSQSQLVLGRPRLGPITKHRSIQFSHPILDAQGRFDGIVFASVNPDLYARFLETVLLDPNGGTAVITLSGHMVARAPKHEEKFGIDISNSDLFVRYLPRATEGTAHLISKADGNDKLLGYRVLPGFPLVVTSGYSRDKTLHEWRIVTVLSTALAVIASLILYFWAHRADQHAGRLAHYRWRLATEVANRTSGLAAAREATEERSERLAEANNRLHELIQLIAADLQQPLAELTHHIGELRELASGQSEEGDHWLGFITAANIHLNALLRDYPRYVAALCDEPRLCPTNCAAVAEDAISKTRKRWPAEKIRFDVQPLPAVQADASMVLEVFVQLFTNAASHCQGHQPITVTVCSAPHQDGWRITVADDGPGLPPINSEHLFRAFETAHDRNPDSTGLGLPLCRVLVQSHGGHIWATSMPGKGCSIHFTLPVAEDIHSASA